jgi:isoleucyl-tRNA synthetase
MDTKDTEKSDVARREEEVLAFWREHDIFNKSLEKESPKGDFVFYDGPPFATGLPHYGHILAGTIKDAIPRFATMNGYRVKRKWGWDCHGLPLENIIEKRLGLATKRDIEAMGVKQFNEAAREAVLEYADDWRRIIPRMGRFVDMDDDYRTMDATYTESVWWVFSELNKKGLVYEGFKSMHLCPRCGTTLSNFEVNQGYKDIKDIAVTVKMPLLDDAGNETDTSILIWTTTPWTLPGNMAVAVNNDIEYVKVKVTVDDIAQFVILAKARLAQLGTDAYEIIEEMKGSDLVGKRYVPPFDSFTTQEFKDKENAWKIYHADYVEVGEEGTGAVHIAPAYGEEDLNLAKQENIPIQQHVGEDGRFKEFVTHFALQLVKPKDDEQADVSHLDSDIEVVKRLKDAGKLFKKENITHSYPHCWRCDTPLLNYATTSWFVRVTDIKDKLVSENAKVKWVPEHVGTNRFGKWLEGARDWAISRQRYWGAPLPIWRNEATKEYKVFGSLNDLKQYVPSSGNKYFLMRHGESELNTRWILNGELGVKNGLTEKGVAQVASAIESLKSANIDLVIHSPLERTTETARRVHEALGLPPESLIMDERIREMRFGEFEGKEVNDYEAFFGTGLSRLTTHPEKGESWNEVKQRMGAFLYDIHEKYAAKNILIVSHNGALQMLQAAAYGTDHATLGGIVERDEYDIQNAEVREMSFTPIPHNDNYELDFHRPYIDAIKLFDTDGGKLVRVPDVFDCWFESGSMPYAQNHYPFENLEEFNLETDKRYPADFIAESIDQTRGWFYSLMVLGVALTGKSPFKHVITNGLVLAEDGKKMSKSLQNYPDPMDLANRVGVDAIRFYLLSSPIIKAEDLNFSEKEVLELQRKNLGRLHNVLAMYEMYADGSVTAHGNSPHVLDRWILSRLNETVRDITGGYTNYELDKATRPIEGLIDDISVWYLRRSRERLKQNAQNGASASLQDPTASSAVQESTSPSSVTPRLASDVHSARSGADDSDKNACLSTLRYVLKNLALVMAPSMPFYAEYLFGHVREEGDAESVHLMNWPEGGSIDQELQITMGIVRASSTIGLKMRSEHNIKVRQPLPFFTIVFNDVEPKYWTECKPILEEELNVKEVTFVRDITKETSSYELDTTITPELKQEGDVRELIRAIQDSRKEKGLMPEDRIVLSMSEATKQLVGKFEDEVLRITGASEARTCEGNRSVTIDGVTYTFDIEK